MRLVEAEAVARELWPVAEAVPDLALQVLLAAKEDRARLGIEHHHQHRLRFAEAGEVVEAAVPAIVVVAVGVARALGRGRKDHHAGAEGARQPRPALAETL